MLGLSSCHNRFFTEVNFFMIKNPINNGKYIYFNKSEIVKYLKVR